MGVPLFGVDISGIIARSMGPGLPQVRLLVPQVTPPSDDDPTAAPTTSYRRIPCRGFEEDAEELRRRGTQVQADVRVVLILGDTLPTGVVPVPGHRIEILGETLEITGDGVTSDPARATYVCACRG